MESERIEQSGIPISDLEHAGNRHDAREFAANVGAGLV
jgi:hypothetical protein